MNALEGSNTAASPAEVAVKTMDSAEGSKETSMTEEVVKEEEKAEANCRA